MKRVRLRNLASKRTAYLQFKHTPDTVYPNHHKILLRSIILFEELHKHIQTTTADKHLEGEGRGRIHLFHERCSFQANAGRVLFRSKFGYDGNSANETNVFLDFYIVISDLNQLVVGTWNNLIILIRQTHSVHYSKKL